MSSQRPHGLSRRCRFVAIGVLVILGGLHKRHPQKPSLQGAGSTRPRSGASRRSPGGSRTFFGLKVKRPLPRGLWLARPRRGWVSSSYPGVHGTPGIPPHAWCARTPSRRPSLALQQQHQNRGSDEPDEQQLIQDVHQSRPLTPTGPRPGSAPTAHRADGRGLGDALRPGRVFWHFAQTNVGRKTWAPGFSRMAASAL